MRPHVVDGLVVLHAPRRPVVDNTPWLPNGPAEMPRDLHKSSPAYWPRKLFEFVAGVCALGGLWLVLAMVPA